MPNHIRNEVYALHKNDELHAAFKGKDARGEEKEMTFNAIIPTPSNVIQGTIQCGVQYDQPTWYDWNCENWGTKWDCYDEGSLGWGVEFNTAWSTPEPVIRALAKKIDDIVFCIYADEDIGSNCGAYICTPSGRIEHVDAAYLFAYAFREGVDFCSAIKDYIEWNEIEEDE